MRLQRDSLTSGFFPPSPWRLSDSVEVLEKLAGANTTVDGDSVGGTAAESYIIRFPSGLRAKVKLADYLKIHALFTGTNERTIWEVLAAGNDPAALFDQVPDEFRDWAHRVAERMRAGRRLDRPGHRRLPAARAPGRPEGLRPARGQLPVQASAVPDVRRPGRHRPCVEADSPRGDASPYKSDDEG
ncbi:hypothetical protein FE633_17380 [Streptomyces montanus]|uniref:Uncharacterized protein n=1 Tax=Streptomyces montanus TaxID=2580423 RepID=A0A5R9FU88_9ACTN|nr:hypothetical protein [Streptomyces montanus]TLS44918.1 hypothetical protein FE633_17380 [Streptomyces montanus]